jgi:hypothetical protein
MCHFRQNVHRYGEYRPLRRLALVRLISAFAASNVSKPTLPSHAKAGALCLEAFLDG